MEKSNSDIAQAPQKAVENADRRLKNFFDDCDSAEPGLIYVELSNSSDRFKNFEEIASGGMKTIYAVDDVHADRKLAMALLHDGAESENIEPFLREARLTARLDHPNIIKVHDIGLNEDKKPYFTMDLKSGDSLSDFLKSDNSLHESLLIFLKVCDAVSYAHSLGVLHLDLKPGNIQIGEYGEVLVCDWGLGKIIDDDKFTDDYSSGSYILNNATLHGHIKGTPGFMAPEQISGETKTRATDIFALGAILYNVLTGKKAYRGSVETVLKKTVDYPPLEPTTIAPDKKIPESLNAVVMKAMALNPEERYKSVQGLSKEIRAYLSGFATEAENAGVVKILSLLVKRHKAAFGVLLCALIILLVLAFMFIREIQKEKNNALSARDRANELSFAEKNARRKAEHTSGLLLKEKEDLKLLNEKFAEDLTLQSVFVAENINHWDIYDEKIYLKTLDNLEKATRRAPNNHLAWAHRAILLFIMQRYEEALNAFQHSKNIKFIEPVLAKATDFNNDKPVSVEALSQFIHMIDNLKIKRPQRKGLIDKLITYDVNVNQRNHEEKLELTKALIKVWNFGWEGSVSYDPQSRKMVISGLKLKVLRTTKNTETIKHNLLRLLKPISVTFVDTSLTDLFHLSDMSLQELDIRGTKIKSLQSLNKFKQLTTLIIRPGQIEKKDKTKIPQWVNVIYK